MTYTIIKRKPHTSFVFRSPKPYNFKHEAKFMCGKLNIVDRDYIRHVERF